MDWAADLTYLGTIAVAGGLGALIGLEREISDKPAGLRTHIFVAAGAALLMVLGEVILDSFQQKEGNDVINADPIRVIHAIVIGISFLGAGTIIHQGGDRIEGLTTAASIFLTAGIGIAVGAGRTPLAAGTAVLAVLVLVLVGWIERFLLQKKEQREETKESSQQADQNTARQTSAA